MSDQIASCYDRLITSETSDTEEGSSKPILTSGEGSCSGSVESACNKVDEAGKNGDPDEKEPLIQMLECRICQEEDSINNLEVPCACSGSLKFAHRKCVQHWCDEKGDITCEICHQPYQPGYTAPPPPPQSDETIIDISEDWASSAIPVDLNGAPLLAAAAAERHFLDAEYDDYVDTSSNGAAFCRATALILMALLLLRHALNLSNPEDDDDPSTFFSLFVLRAAGFLLPCYIMAWAISILQRRRQRQEAAALAAAEVAFMIHAGQRRGLHFAISPAATGNHHHPEAPQ